MRNNFYISIVLFLFIIYLSFPSTYKNEPNFDPHPTISPDKNKIKSIESLKEVNELRAKHKLHPFIEDKDLTAGALAVAQYRAENLIEGHTENDFEFLPEGVKADAAGCAAWFPKDGWGSCCMLDNYKYAGAAYCMGMDGKRYMHLFVKD